MPRISEGGSAIYVDEFCMRKLLAGSVPRQSLKTVRLMLSRSAVYMCEKSKKKKLKR